MNPFAKLKRGLAKTREGIAGRMGEIFAGRTEYSPEVFEALEELLIEADVGVDLSLEIAAAAEKQLGGRKVSGDDIDGVLALLRDRVAEELGAWEPAPEPTAKPHVVLVVGVNGVGKTTSVAKLARRHQEAGRTVLLAAGDTFRAAAGDQLAVWAERLGCRMVRHREGSDPAAVVHDALAAAKARDVDVLIVDTAGRLHNKRHLMEELGKIRRVASREVEGAPHEVLLVLDANTGQNAIEQARVFKETTDVTGVILAKLDGTARGGAVLAIGRELGLPVQYVGLGEGLDDLQPFVAGDFAAALLDRE